MSTMQAVQHEQQEQERRHITVNIIIFLMLSLLTKLDNFQNTWPVSHMVQKQYT